MTASISSFPIETNDGTRTTWVPLSTFSAPQACTNTFRDIGDRGEMLAFDPNYQSLDSRYSCMPGPASLWWSQNTQSASTYTTKIGIAPIVCPADWAVVQTSIKDESSTFSMCCPTGYERSDGVNAQAVVNIEGAHALKDYAKACVSSVNPGRVVTLYTIDRTTVTTFTAQSTVFALGLIGMNIGTASPSTKIPATTVSNEASKTGSVSNTASGSAEMSQGNSSNSSGLSTIAKVGIGLGVALGTIVLIGLLAFFILWFRKSQKRRAAGQRRIHAEAYSQPVAELDQAHTTPRQPIEKYSRPRAELEAR